MSRKVFALPGKCWSNLRNFFAQNVQLVAKLYSHNDFTRFSWARVTVFSSWRLTNLTGSGNKFVMYVSKEFNISWYITDYVSSHFHWNNWGREWSEDEEEKENLQATPRFIIMIILMILSSRCCPPKNAKHYGDVTVVNSLRHER